MSGQNISLSAHSGSEFTAYFAAPDMRPQAARAPAVLVLQEIFGVNAFVREVCDRFADAGFFAIAPDLFWRQEPGVQLSESQFEKAMRLNQGLDHPNEIYSLCPVSFGSHNRS
jgi:carboxymethylenebutenolidase